MVRLQVKAVIRDHKESSCKTLKLSNETDVGESQRVFWGT